MILSTKIGVDEATRAFRVWKEYEGKKEEQEVEKSEKKPQPYKHIKVGGKLATTRDC